MGNTGDEHKELDRRSHPRGKSKPQAATPWENLRKHYDLADAIDISEGMVAYERYNIVMRRLAAKYEYSLDAVCAVFCSLSPNSDYWGNLRSTVSVLQGLNEGRRDHEITVSTYGHCKLRAVAYARGVKSFPKETKGPKILNFYHNILAPHSSQWVTIDGHMVGVLRDDRKGTMRDLLISPREYVQYADLVKSFAFSQFMLPNQMQAVLWFVRKRITNTVYDGQLDMLTGKDDAWKTVRDVDTIKPYHKADSILELKPGSMIVQTLALEGGAWHGQKESKKARPSKGSSAKA